MCVLCNMYALYQYDTYVLHRNHQSKCNLFLSIFFLVLFSFKITDYWLDHYLHVSLTAIFSTFIVVPVKQHFVIRLHYYCRRCNFIRLYYILTWARVNLFERYSSYHSKLRNETFVSKKDKKYTTVRTMSTCFPMKIRNYTDDWPNNWPSYLPFRYLSPLFVLIANRPIVKLFLTLCMMILVAHSSIKFKFSFFISFNRFTLLKIIIIQNLKSRIFCHVTNY